MAQTISPTYPQSEEMISALSATKSVKPGIEYRADMVYRSITYFVKL